MPDLPTLLTHLHSQDWDSILRGTRYGEHTDEANTFKQRLYWAREEVGGTGALEYLIADCQENAARRVVLEAAVAELRGSLKEMLDLVKSAPELQGREHIGLGIRVNSALTATAGLVKGGV